MPQLTHPDSDLLAAHVTGTLYGALWHAERSARTRHHHYPSAFDPAWCARLPLDTDAPEHPVQLADGTGFEDHQEADTLRAAYRANPRTRIYTGLQHSTPWLDRTTEHLTRLTHSQHHVKVVAFHSTPLDARPGIHTDQFHAAILHLQGRKHWRLGPGLRNENEDIHSVTLSPGDLLIIPDGLPHDASTPADPGHSLHLVFAIRRHVPTSRQPTPATHT